MSATELDVLDVVCTVTGIRLHKNESGTHKRIALAREPAPTCDCGWIVGVFDYDKHDIPVKPEIESMVLCVPVDVAVDIGDVFSIKITRR